MSEFTKGPWTWDGEYPIRIVGGEEGEDYVVSAGGLYPSQEADVRLITAAPELLEAAKLAVSVLRYMAKILEKTPEDGTVIPKLGELYT